LRPQQAEGKDAVLRLGSNPDHRSINLMARAKRMNIIKIADKPLRMTNELWNILDCVTFSGGVLLKRCLEAYSPKAPVPTAGAFFWNEAGLRGVDNSPPAKLLSPAGGKPPKVGGPGCETTPEPFLGGTSALVTDQTVA
jgi:hypothetical protein